MRSDEIEADAVGRLAFDHLSQEACANIVVAVQVRLIEHGEADHLPDDGAFGVNVRLGRALADAEIEIFEELVLRVEMLRLRRGRVASKHEFVGEGGEVLIRDQSEFCGEAGQVGEAHAKRLIRSELRPQHLLVRETPAHLDALGIAYESDRKFLPNLATLWVENGLRETLAKAGIGYLDPNQVLTYHLAFVLKKHTPGRSFISHLL